MTLPAPTRVPLQFTPWRKEQFESREGIDFFNQSQQQIVNMLNYLMGHSGAVEFPAGIDMAGANIKGLAVPAGPSDAVPAGHAESNYGASSVSPKLDVGGSNSLKGVSSLFLALGKVATGKGLNATVVLAKVTVGGTNGSLTVQNGIVTAYTAPS